MKPWHPRAEGAYALALAIVYRLVSTDYAARVPDELAAMEIVRVSDLQILGLCSS